MVMASPVARLPATSMLPLAGGGRLVSEPRERSWRTRIGSIELGARAAAGGAAFLGVRSSVAMAAPVLEVVRVSCRAGGEPGQRDLVREPDTRDRPARVEELAARVDAERREQ